MTFRAPLDFTLPATATDWSLSSVRSFAMRRVREHAVTHHASVVDVTDWGYRVDDVPGGGQRVRVTCVATLRSRRELIDAVQSLMAERQEHMRCTTCEAIDSIRVRHDAGSTYAEACAAVGIHPNTARYHDPLTHSLRRP